MLETDEPSTAHEVPTSIDKIDRRNEIPKASAVGEKISVRQMLFSSRQHVGGFLCRAAALRYLSDVIFFFF